MTNQPIKTLFASNIQRRIEEVIKVDQTDEQILRDEIDEYVVTDAICSHYVGIFDAYQETPNKPHEGIGVWVSGFFGSGKSSFAKMLGFSIANRPVAGASIFSRPSFDRSIAPGQCCTARERGTIGPCPENGSNRAIDGRDRARLQQPASGNHSLA